MSPDSASGRSRLQPSVDGNNIRLMLSGDEALVSVNIASHKDGLAPIKQTGYGGGTQAAGRDLITACWSIAHG